MRTSNLAELQGRWNALNELASRVRADDRRLSTGLDLDDKLVRNALDCRVPLVTPLTIGTLLASVLSEIDGIEMAIEAVRRDEHPGEDAPNPLADWERRSRRESSHEAARASS